MAAAAAAVDVGDDDDAICERKRARAYRARDHIDVNA